MQKKKRRAIEVLAKEGFSLDATGHRLKDLALFSLRAGIRAYVSTYRSMRYSLHLFDGAQEQAAVDWNHHGTYIEQCAEALLHLQHFAELSTKQFLFEAHPLLVSSAATKPLVLYQLLKGEKIDESDLEALKWEEFSITIERLYALHDAGRLEADISKVLTGAKGTLRELNTLRNRILHRGRFILRYDALDEFISGYALPFALSVVSLPKFAPLRSFWAPQPLKCGLDPLLGLAQELAGATYDIRKVAFLKELARAAYENPLNELRFFKHENEEAIARAETAAESHHQNPADVLECPVCGVKSLALFDDVETEGEDPETGTYEKAWRYTYMAQCSCCSFEVTNDLKNPSEHGLPIPDLWSSREF